MLKNKIGFTLVELLVVIVVLGILSTLGFISYTGYISGVRDSNRISQIEEIRRGLEGISVKGKLPYPDSKINISVNGKIVAYQGYAGKNVLLDIQYSEKGIDPKDGTYFTYYLTKSKKYFQLMTFLEEPRKTSLFIGKITAIDYSKRFPYVVGDKLGIMTDSYNTPLQEFTGSMDVANLGNLELKSYFKGERYVKGSGSTMITELEKLKEIDNEGGDMWFVVNNQFTRESDQGVCGTDNGVNLNTTPINLCSSGRATSVIDNGVGSTYVWSCNGDNPLKSVVCSANHINGGTGICTIGGGNEESKIGTCLLASS